MTSPTLPFTLNRQRKASATIMKSARPVLPAVGDVIRYAYLWSHESGAGREEGTKDRPAAIVALLRGDEGRDGVNAG